MMRYSLVLAAFVAACSSATDAQIETNTTPVIARSKDVLPNLDVVVTVARTTLAPGDTITLVASATNRGAERLQIGVACGPSLDVLVSPPNAAEYSALIASLPPNAGFTCPLTPAHFADPGETETVRIIWRAPAQTGAYRLQAGLRRGDGLGNLGPATTVTVR
jgi:hypothetical protein